MLPAGGINPDGPPDPCVFRATERMSLPSPNQMLPVPTTLLPEMTQADLEQLTA